jgi:hypothetical protein
MPTKLWTRLSQIVCGAFKAVSQLSSIKQQWCYWLLLRDVRVVRVQMDKRRLSRSVEYLVGML